MHHHTLHHGTEHRSEHGSDRTELADHHGIGWFEACVEYRGPSLEGPCGDCGWLAVDHDAGLAVVIDVTRIVAAPLRRAS